MADFRLCSSLFLIVPLAIVLTFQVGRSQGRTDNLEARLDALSDSNSTTMKSTDERITELESLGKAIMEAWDDTRLDEYGRLVLRLCDVIGGLQGSSVRRIYLAQQFAMQSLDNSDKLDLVVECALLRYVQSARGADGKVLTGDALSQLRRRQVGLWLRALQRVESAVDPNFDINDPDYTGVGNVSVPGPGGPPAGIAPDAISDPELRAKYKAAIEENRIKIERATSQVRARDLKTYWVKDAERFVIQAYLASPNAIDELNGIMNKYSINQELRTRIAGAIRNNKFPESLEVKNTTRPAE